MKTWTLLPRLRARSLRNSHLSVYASAALLAVAVSGETSGQSLRGGTRSLDLQNRVARQHDFTYIATPAQVERFVNEGYLVQVPASADYVLHEISFPYARSEVKLFISARPPVPEAPAASGSSSRANPTEEPAAEEAPPRAPSTDGMALDFAVPPETARMAGTVSAPTGGRGSGGEMSAGRRTTTSRSSRSRTPRTSNASHAPPRSGTRPAEGGTR